MKTTKRRKSWVVIALIAALVVGGLLFSQTDTADALFTDAHVIKIFWRVEEEIMQKSPAGQSYEAITKVCFIIGLWQYPS